MSKKLLHEWFITAPWGKIAMVAYGNPKGKPVLLVHGRQDSVATFERLLEMLPDSYYYVGLDLPGHGKSDPFPIGLVIMRLHFVTAVERVLDHLNWDQFIYIGHSMGSEIGLFYNAIYPNRVTKFVHLDVMPGLQGNQMRPIQEFYETFYDSYYNNYGKRNVDDRVYTKARALDAVMKARGLNEDEAELVLSRNLVTIDKDYYKLSWDKRLKFVGPMILPNDFYLHIFSKNAPPTLFIMASNSTSSYKKGKEATLKLLSDMEKTMSNFIVKRVEGNHDLHLNNPESIASDICEFLSKAFVSSKSKL